MSTLTHNWMEQAARATRTHLSPHATGEACGPCPRCGGTDRFVVWEEGNAYCRQCKYKTWWARPDDASRVQAERKVAREQEIQRSRQEMQGCSDWKEYHNNVLEREPLQEMWIEQGMTLDDVMRWGLGWTDSCPNAPGEPSLTIPVFHEGLLLDIRHRLVNGEQGNKYRSHRKGLRPFPFNLDSIHYDQQILVVEGEKKAIICSRFGYAAAVGLPGTGITSDLLLALRNIEPVQYVTIAFDPGANEQAEGLAEQLARIGVETYVADLIDKPDDLLLEFGRETLDAILAQSRRF